MTFALLVVSTYAYDWGGGPASPINWHMVPSDFTPAEEAAVAAAFEAWDAGSGEVIRGASMDINRDTDRTSGGLCNLKNEVFMKDQDFFDAHGWSADIAALSPCLGSYDIVFNSDISWCTSAPSACGSGFSIGQTAVHEMGHWVGFLHFNEGIATMNDDYPAGGDLGDTTWRIHEDDYVGLVDHRPGSSTGNNFMVARYDYAGGGSSNEVWDASDGPWEFSRGSDTWPDERPDEILAVLEGTSNNLSPTVQWLLSANTNCTTLDYLIGSRTPTLTSNTAYSIGPNAWNLADTVPTGNYYLCVIIDAGSSFSETSEADNTVISEVQVEVIP